MSEKAFDYKREYKDLYMPKCKPVLIEVPSMNFIMADGKGDPSNNEDFQQVAESSNDAFQNSSETFII